MSAVEVVTWDADREKWLAARTSGIGASEIAAVVGQSPYDSPLSLHLRKRGLLGPKDLSDQMHWGNMLEPALRDEFASRHPELTVCRVGLLRSSERPWQLATPDGEVVERDGDAPEPLELKTADGSQAHLWGPHGSDVIPVHYRAQVQQQIDVMDAQRAHVAVLIGGSDYREYIVHRDAEDIALMRAAGEAFWADVLAEREPPVDGHEQTTAALKELHPDIEDRDVVVDEDLLDRYLGAIAAAKTADKAKRLVENELRDLIGDGHRAVLADGTKVATRSVYEQASFSATRLKEARPDLHRQFSSVITINKLIAPRLPKDAAA